MKKILSILVFLELNLLCLMRCAAAVPFPPMENFDETFAPQPCDWQTELVGENNVLTDETTASLTFKIIPKQDFHGIVRLEIVEYSTRWNSKTPLRPVIYRVGSPTTAEQEVTLPADGGMVNFQVNIGPRLGGYGVIMELLPGDQSPSLGRAFAASLIRVVGEKFSSANCTFTETNLLRDGVYRANSADRVGTVYALQRCKGLPTACIARDYFSQTNGTEFFWASAAALSAAQTYIGNRPFSGKLLRNGCPDVLIFEPEKASDGDGTLFVVGETFSVSDWGWANTTRVGLQPGAALVLENKNELFEARDFAGNALETIDGKLQIPLHSSGYYLRSKVPSAGNWKRLKHATQTADFHNIAPISFTIYDLTTAVTNAKSELKLRVFNNLNTKISGTLQVLIPGIFFEKDTLELSLQPGQNRLLSFEIIPTMSTPRDGNNYPGIFAWTDENGTLKHAETLHVNSIPRATAKVDGDLGEWDKNLACSALNPIHEWDPLNIYTPYKDWVNALEKTIVRGWASWDDTALYFAMQTPFPLDGKEVLKIDLGDEDWIYSYDFGTLFTADIQTAVKGRAYECSIPWSAIPEIHNRVKKGKTICLDYELIASDGRRWHYSAERSNPIPVFGTR